MIFGSVWRTIKRLFGFDRYDRVKAKTLKWNQYYDIDMRMLHVNFQLLVDYVKYEAHMIDWSTTHKDIWEEILDLYDWWTRRRALRETATNSILDMLDLGSKGNYDHKLFEAYGVAEEKDIAEDEEMLIRLIKIRGHLWS